MKKVHIQIADPTSPLAKDLAKALPRSGTEIVETVEPGVAVMNISAATFSTDVLSVGGNARATEYSLRYHVELEVRGRRRHFAAAQADDRALARIHLRCERRRSASPPKSTC